MSRRSLLGWVVALAFLGAGCAVDATVTVTVRPDGSGSVAVDVVADAAAVQTAEVAGGTLEDRVRLADLPAAGWRVGRWVRADDGSASIRLVKRFASVDDVPGILEELDGAHGPLRDASFRRTRSFFGTRFAAEVDLDLGAASTGISDDAELVARLQAEGVDVAGIEQQLAGQLRDGLTIRFVVDLPGPGRTVIAPEPGEAQGLVARSTVRDTTRITLVVVAGLLVLLAVVVASWPRRRGRRRRNRRRARRRNRTADGRTARGGAVRSGGRSAPTTPGSPPAT